MKTLSKGLILVGIPLLYGIVFTASIFFGASQANRLLQNVHIAEDSIFTFGAASRDSVCAIRYQAIHVATQRELWHQRAELNEKLANSAYAHLDVLRKADPSLSIPSNKAGRSGSIPFSPGPEFAAHVAELGRVFLGEHQILLGDLADLTYQLRNQCEAYKEDAASAIRFLRIMLYLGIAAEFVLSIALIAYLIVSISNGLKKILNNTINFSRGIVLSAPLKGTDEIAELDRFLFLTAQQISELEAFKKEMTEVIGEELKAPLEHMESFLLSLKDGQYAVSNPESIDKITACSTDVQRLIAKIGDVFRWHRSDSVAAGPSSSNNPDSNTETEPKITNIPPMKFSGLKQGILGISASFLIQLIFVVLLAGMVENINNYNQLEEKSRKFLMSVNQSSTDFLEATRFGMVYTYTKVPVYRQMFQDGLAKAIAEIDQAKEQVNDRPDQTKDLQLSRDAMVRFPSRLEQERARLAVEYAHNPSGSFATMDELMNLFKDPDHPSKPLIDRIQALIDDKVHVQSFQLFFDTQDAMERLISREVSSGEALAAQREHLFSMLNLTLLATLGFVCIMSMLLANFLIKNLNNRIKHVMANTSRLIKREKLEPPGAVTDEITYLDKFLCQTADRLIALEQFKRSLIEIESAEIRSKIMSVCTTFELLSQGALGELSAAEKEELKVVEEEARNVLRSITDFRSSATTQGINVKSTNQPAT